jgi:hypothetical protein
MSDQVKMDWKLCKLTQRKKLSAIFISRIIFGYWYHEEKHRKAKSVVKLFENMLFLEECRLAFRFFSKTLYQSPRGSDLLILEISLRPLSVWVGGKEVRTFRLLNLTLKVSEHLTYHLFWHCFYFLILLTSNRNL